MDTVGAAWDLARDAVLLGWAATAVFCAVAGAAIALWGGLRWWLGLLLGALTLYAGLLVLLLLAGLRVGERTRVARAERRAVAVGTSGTAVGTDGTAVPPAFPPPAPVPASVPAALLAPPPPGYALAAGAGPSPSPGFRAQLRAGWQRWTRTPPTRSERTVAALAVLLAVGLVVATQLTWLKLSAVGYGVVTVGPFGVQLGLFVVTSALAALVCAVGLLRWRSAWWPVLLAWFGCWWLFVAVEVRRADGALAALNRLLRDQVRDRLGYDVRPALALGVGWSVMLWLAAAMLVLSVVLLVLQGRRSGQYRPLARLSTPGPAGHPA